MSASRSLRSGLVVILLAMPLLGGCVVAAIGVAAGAVAWSVSDNGDVVLPVERDYETAFEATRIVLERWGGEPEVVDRPGYLIHSKYDGHEVTVTFVRKPDHIELTIKGRKGYGRVPARSLAEDIAEGITSEVTRR